MALIDIKLPKSIARALNLPISTPKRTQLKVLKKMLRKSRFTEFGQKYKFDEILQAYEVFGNAAKEKAMKVIIG